MKTRYDPAAPGRFPDDFEARCHRLAARDYPLTVAFNGPFWQLREWCGFENLCLLTVEDPDFVLEMADFWRGFVLEVLERLLARLVPDLVLISEDMAYKGKSMISPVMVRRFLVPSWRAWTGRVRRAGCPVVEIDSDGFVGELIPLWIEAGIGACSPMEVAAGNDLPAYRRRFNRDIAFRGGIDKRAIARGGETMARAVRETVVPLLAGGGYIPSCDHGVPPDVSWPDFVAYARLLARLTGWLPG
jgi:uroporphyrinogen decarboxylase